MGCSSEYPLRFILVFKQFLTLLPQEMLQLFFMVAEFFLTIFTRKAHIAILGKAFGMALINYLPFYEQYQRNCNDAVCEHIGYENKRCEHHRIVPVIYAAGGAAFVLHYPRVERTEEQYAYHIAHRKSKTQQYQYTCIINTQ